MEGADRIRCRFGINFQEMSMYELIAVDSDIIAQQSNEALFSVRRTGYVKPRPAAWETIDFVISLVSGRRHYIERKSLAIAGRLRGWFSSLALT